MTFLDAILMPITAGLSLLFPLAVIEMIRFGLHGEEADRG